MQLDIETTCHKCDKTGREYLRFTPVATFRPYAGGELRFPIWEVWIDEPLSIATQRQKAVESAIQSMRAMLPA